jgi:serine acetyltransferase
MPLLQDIRSDLTANQNSSKGKCIVVSYRIANYIALHRLSVIRILGRPWVKLHEFVVMWFLSTEIPTRTKIGPGLSIPHGLVIINDSAVIGKNVLIRQFTTIGSKGTAPYGSPVIGDNVSIGANTVLIGEITIGDNVIIGAGTTVTKSVPANSVVYGNPVKILPL